MRRTICAVVASLAIEFFGISAQGCSKITFGEVPLKVTAISGVVAGNAAYDEAAKSRRRLAAVRVELLKRTDTKYSKDVVAKRFRNTVGPEMIAEWSCSGVVATTISDGSGNIALPQVAPGKYCLNFEGPEYDSVNHARMGQRFLINVDVSATHKSVTVDISPLWSDCAGGGKIEYAQTAETNK